MRHQPRAKKMHQHMHLACKLNKHAMRCMVNAFDQFMMMAYDARCCARLVHARISVGMRCCYVAQMLGYAR